MASITKPLSQIDSADLLISARAGATEAFEELIRRVHRPALRAAFRILKNMEDAEDAFQDAALRAFTRLSEFRGDSAFSTWFTRITINTCLMELRRRSRRNLVCFDVVQPDGSIISEEIASNEVNAESRLLQEERQQILFRSIDTLTPDLRAITLDMVRSEAKVSTLAKNHGITISAAKSRLLRARRQMTSRHAELPVYSTLAVDSIVPLASR